MVWPIFKYVVKKRKNEGAAERAEAFVESTKTRNMQDVTTFLIWRSTSHKP